MTITIEAHGVTFTAKRIPVYARGYTPFGDSTYHVTKRAWVLMLGAEIVDGDDLPEDSRGNSTVPFPTLASMRDYVSQLDAAEVRAIASRAALSAAGVQS